LHESNKQDEEKPGLVIDALVALKSDEIMMNEQLQSLKKLTNFFTQDKHKSFDSRAEVKKYTMLINYAGLNSSDQQNLRSHMGNIIKDRNSFSNIIDTNSTQREI
jgi:hypothetical protein